MSKKDPKTVEREEHAGTIRYWRVPTEELVAQQPADYVATGFEQYLEKKLFGSPLLIKGPKGAGKTISIEKVLADREICMIRHPCTEDDTARHLFGSRRLDGDFQLGPVTAAIDVANQEGACALVLEEMNALSPRTQKALNSLTDYRREVQLAGIGKTFRLKPDAQIWVVGTANPNYAGTYDLNEDLVSRFTMVTVGYMAEALEIEVLTKSFERTMDRSAGPKDRVALKRLVELATYSRNGSLRYGISTRDLVTVVQSWADLGSLPLALRELEGKFDSTSLPDFRARVQSTFEIDLATVKLWHGEADPTPAP